MGAAVKGRAGINKAAPPPRSSNKDPTARSSGRGGIVGVNAQREILKHVGAGDVKMRETRNSTARGLVELKVGNWNKSKASSNPDGGASSLVSWLEKKATNKLGSRVRAVKIKKVCRRHRLCCCAGHRHTYSPGRHPTSGPPSLAANFRTTTAIQDIG